MVTAASTFFQTKRPTCQAKCGNVSIPYPFGIYDAAGGDGCSINGVGYGFGVTCNTSFHPPKPFFGQGKHEVLSISESEIRLKTNKVARVCYTKSGVFIKDQESSDLNQVSYDLRGTSFTFSYTKNSLFAIGCDTGTSFDSDAADGNRIKTYTNECRSQCNSREEVIDGSCSEKLGCCQVTIPRGINYLWGFVMSFDNHTEVWSFDQCSYALFAEKDQYTFHASDLLLPSTDFIAKGSNMPLVLDWAIGNKTCEEAYKDLACQENSKCINSDNNQGYRCACFEGYQGNPYLSPGCQDINECEDQSRNDCVESTCKNTIGSYICICPEGSLGDGRKPGLGCFSKKKVLLRVAL
ncbi:hypothetical protein MKW92_048909, partial [Papaver armeniacum]